MYITMTHVKRVLLFYCILNSMLGKFMHYITESVDRKSENNG